MVQVTGSAAAALTTSPSARRASAATPPGTLIVEALVRVFAALWCCKRGHKGACVPYVPSWPPLLRCAPSHQLAMNDSAQVGHSA